MIERTEVFGRVDSLVGTWCEPEVTAVPGVAFLLLPAGVIHRIGPHRLNVKLSRMLAAGGLPSLRMDVAGVGDSRIPPGARPYLEQAVLDIRSAMDHAEARHGIRKFVVGGICSGADQAFRVAVADARVVGVWMMDGFTYPTWRSRIIRRARRLSLHSFGTALGRARSGALSWLRASANRLRPTPRVDATPPPANGRGTPTRSEFAAQMQALADRGTELFVMYSGTLQEHYNYAGQFRDAFRSHRFVGSTRCEFLPDVDHTVTLLRSQQEVIARILDWSTAPVALGGWAGPPRPAPRRESASGNAVGRDLRGSSSEQRSPAGTRHAPKPPARDSVSVLVVCHANICRSPMAEVVIATCALREGRSDVLVRSAGIRAPSSPRPVDPRTVDALQRRGYATPAMTSAQFLPQHFAEYDLVLAMDSTILEHLQSQCPPEHASKVMPFMSYAAAAAEPEVPDPYYAGPEAFERALTLCEQAARGLIDALRGPAAPMPPT